MSIGRRGLLGQIQQNRHRRAQDGQENCEENPNEPTERLVHAIFNSCDAIFNSCDMCFDLGQGECVLFRNRFKPCQPFVGSGL